MGMAVKFMDFDDGQAGIIIHTNSLFVSHPNLWGVNSQDIWEKFLGNLFSLWLKIRRILCIYVALQVSFKYVYRHKVHIRINFREIYAINLICTPHIVHVYVHC